MREAQCLVLILNLHSSLSYSWGMSVNSAGNKMIIADYNKNRVEQIFTVSGTSRYPIPVSWATSASWSSTLMDILKDQLMQLTIATVTSMLARYC